MRSLAFMVMLLCVLLLVGCVSAPEETTQLITSDTSESFDISDADIDAVQFVGMWSGTATLDNGEERTMTLLFINDREVYFAYGIGESTLEEYKGGWEINTEKGTLEIVVCGGPLDWKEGDSDSPVELICEFEFEFYGERLVLHSIGFDNLINNADDTLIFHH